MPEPTRKHNVHCLFVPTMHNQIVPIYTGVTDMWLSLEKHVFVQRFICCIPACVTLVASSQPIPEPNQINHHWPAFNNLLHLVKAFSRHTSVTTASAGCGVLVDQALNFKAWKTHAGEPSFSSRVLDMLQSFMVYIALWTI